MKNTTLCYIEQNNNYLMMLRNKKKHDLNQNKWIGVGGKFEEGESPEDCLIRETYEETGLTLTGFKLRGIVTFISDEWGCEYMHLFTADKFEGELIEVTDSEGAGCDNKYGPAYVCNEGELHWISKSEVMGLNMWEGDRAFFDLIFNDSPFFTMKLTYAGDELTDISTYVY